MRSRACPICTLQYQAMRANVAMIGTEVEDVARERYVTQMEPWQQYQDFAGSVDLSASQSSFNFCSSKSDCFEEFLF